MPTLEPEQVKRELAEHPDWFADDTATTIARTFQLTDFQRAIVFVNQVAKIAEENNHHPDIFIHSYNKVTVSLTTHDEGGLTPLDFTVAEKIDAI